MAGVDWDAYLDVYDHFTQPHYAQDVHDFYVWLADMLDEREVDPATLLEIGCGTGILVEKLLEWLPETHFVLVDRSPSMLGVARQRLAGRDVAFHESAGEAFLEDLAAESVDVAVFCRSWFTLRDHAAQAAHTARGLRPGGLVFVGDMVRSFDLERYDAGLASEEPDRWPVYRRAIEEFNRGVEDGTYTLFQRDDLEALWRDAGCEMVAYEPVTKLANLYRACFTRA